MIKKLRIKFTAAAMLSVIAVLTVILGTANILNYKKVIADADHVLSILADNDGSFPDMPPKMKAKPTPDNSPEVPFESRFFSVHFNRDGQIASTDTGKIAAINTATAQEYARQVMDSVRQSGFISNYRYVKHSSGNQTLVVFLDCTRSLSTFRTFLAMSILVSSAGVLAVFLLVILLSKKIVTPFAESYEKQKRFITDAGHELKTPLTIIDADAAVLEMESGENEWLKDIQNQTTRLKDLTNDLIYLSKMEENQDHLQMVEFPVSDIAAETVQSFQSLAKTQNKTFQSEIEPMLSYYGDIKNIQRLFSILLDNALKYSDDSGTISFTIRKKNKNICIHVFNTTELIEQEQIPHLFDRFYRADPSRNSQTSGYGIGLSLARAIVTAHKGKITATTQDGKSLLITIIL